MREYLKRSQLYHAPWVTFGYAITGHKSQGGEWDEVWVDYHYQQNRKTEEYFRWMYTVTTRARKLLFPMAPPTFDDLGEALARGLQRLEGTIPANSAARAESHGFSLQTILVRHGCLMDEVIRRPYAIHIQLAKQDDPFAELGTLDLNYNGKNVISYVRLAFPGASEGLGADIAALKGRSIHRVFPEGDSETGSVESMPKIDSPQFWGDARGREFGRTLFGSIVVQLYKLVKEANDGAASTLLTAVARNFLEMLSLRAEVYLDDAAFQKDLVTDAQRRRMEQSAGKRIRMKFWPSLAEKAFGLMNRCLKANEAIRPAPELVAFLGRNAGRGEWLGFYCANARVRIGDFSGARELLGELARRKRNEAWVWEHLAQAHQDQPTRAVGCLCKALICPIHDQEIAQAMVVRMHRQLARLWSALGRTEDSQRELERASRMEMPRANDEFYRREAASIEQEYLGTKQCAASAATDAARRFEGHLVKRTGNPFGFVTDKAIGPVFIPPRFADRLSNGAFVRGKAQLKADKKKNRLSYCMISVL